jgi:quercetin dioxygenase-like cupin family protein
MEPFLKHLRLERYRRVHVTAALPGGLAMPTAFASSRFRTLRRVSHDALNRRIRMKTALHTLLIGSGVLIAGATPGVWAQGADAPKIVQAPEIKWGPAPASLPPGAQAAVLYGDPAKEGLFTLRLKLPKNYHLPPHAHPKPEVVTVLSGTFHLGMGSSADRAKAQPLKAGSFFAIEPGITHFAYTDEETVVQLNSNGPWGLGYANPKDDPRQKGQ